MRVVTVSGLDGGRAVALGYDMTAALAMAAAMGVPPAAAAAFLPIIEGAAAAAINEGNDG